MATEVQWDDEIAQKVDLGRRSNIVVKDYERALLVNDGEIESVFSPGKYSANKLRDIGRNPDAVYVYLKPFKLKIGIGGVMSEDNVEVGCYGTMRVAVDDINMFYTEVLGDEDAFTEEDLKEFIDSNVQAFLRTELAKHEAKELYRQNDIFVPKLRASLEDFFNGIGMEFKDVNIQGINLPDDIKDALQSKKSQEIELEKERKRQDVEKREQEQTDETLVKKYRELKEAGIDVSEFRESEIAEKDTDVLKEKYRAMQKDSDDASAGHEYSYCPGCGSELQADAKFCHSCGREL